MKRFTLLLIALTVMGACADNYTDSILPSDKYIDVAFERDDTRISLYSGKSIWTKGDALTGFYHSMTNSKWLYDGETGARVGKLYPAATLDEDDARTRSVLVYPYNEKHSLVGDGYDVVISLPATQHYATGSFGTDGVTMIASSDNNCFALRNVCGWLMLQFTGQGESVESITLYGNDGEQLAGDIYVESKSGIATLATDATYCNKAGVDIDDVEIATDLRLLVEEEVILSDKATTFYIALPPQKFSNGIMVDIKCEGYVASTFVTHRSIEIKRNNITPMASLTFSGREEEDHGGGDGGEDGKDDGSDTPTDGATVLYYDNLDGEEATQSYGSNGTYWPYINQFPEFANPTGSAAGNSSYEGSYVSLRTNYGSNSDKSDYAGSGVNYFFFGREAYVTINNIALNGAYKNLSLTFGGEKYATGGDNLYTPSELHVMLSEDGELWHDLNYSYAGTTEGRWNVATADFTLANAPQQLHIKFLCDVDSAYRIDDIKLVTGVGGQLIDLGSIPDDGGSDDGGSGGGSGDGSEDDIPVCGTTYRSGWYELPSEADSNLDGRDDNNDTYYYAHHLCAGSERNAQRTGSARNYSVCFSSEHHCPVWVAAPRHSMYEGSANRTDAYGKDPQIPSDIQYNSKSTGGGCNKGHMLGSAERTSSSATNKQVFYYTNIAPQYSDTFNTGGGAWNNLEDHIDGLVCRDTLYEVVGCYFEKYTDKYGNTGTPTKISFGGRSDVSRPTMFYYALLRTKSGNTGKSVRECSASELQCAAFVICHEQDKGHKPEARDIISIEELEQLTGFSYFDNVPNAPKSVVNASDWL